MEQVKQLENFIASIKDLATKCSDFDEFYYEAHKVNWQKFMKKDEFNRLVSVASVEANLA